jgi:hypothetical protein
MTQTLLKSTDRNTGRPIVFCKVPPEMTPGTPNWLGSELWIPGDKPFEQAVEEWSTGWRPLPVDYCWTSMDIGGYCRTKIRPENQRAQLWACGRHMARFQEDRQRRKENEQRARQRQEQEALVQWELQQYLQVYERLVELGFEEILGGEPRIPYTGSTYVRNTEISMDIKDFLAIVDPEGQAEEEEEYDDDDFIEVEEEFFKTSDL